MDSALTWANIDAASANVAPTSELLPGIDLSQSFVDSQPDYMLSCPSPTEAGNEWTSFFPERASTGPKGAVSQSFAEAGKADGSEATKIGTFPEALTVANSTVNIHLQSQQETELERMEVHVRGIQQTLVRLDASLSAMQTEALGMRVAQAQIQETMEKMMNGLNKFFTHVAFDVAQSPA